MCTNNASTATVTTVAPPSIICCFRDKLVTKSVTCFCAWLIDGMLVEMAIYVRLLKLQLRNFLIRVDDLVPHLHHQLKSNVRLFHCDHDVVNVLAVALHQFADLLV